MKTLGTICLSALLLMLGLCFTPIAYSIYLNNARAARLIAKFDDVENFFEIKGVEFEILNSSMNVSRGIGSATDCIYSASRSYKIIDATVPLSEIEAKASDLKLRPPIWKGRNHLSHVRLIDQSRRPNLRLKSEVFGTIGMLVKIEDGPHETGSALLDLRCG